MGQAKRKHFPLEIGSRESVVAAKPPPAASAEILSTLNRLQNAVWIDRNKIRPDPEQPRKEFRHDELNYLAESLAEHGQLQPITVVKDRDTTEEQYIIQLGERRWRAAGIAGITRLKCIVEKQALSEQQLRTRQYIENELRDGLTTIEKANFYRWLMEHTGKSQREIAELVKTSEANVSKTLAVFKLSEEEQAMASSLGLKEIYQISRKQDPDDRRRLIESFTTGQVTATRLEARKKPKASPTKKKRTIDGLEIRLASSVRLTNPEISKRLRRYAEILENDGRSKA